MLYISDNNNIVIDVTKPPYSLDNTGKVDCTKALCKLIDDLLQREIDGVQAMRTKLLEDTRDNFRIGFENRKMNGVPTVIFPEDPPAARILYFPKGIYLVSDTITYSHKNLANLINDNYSSDLNRFIHIKGEDEKETIIKLQDNCPLFRYGEKRALIDFGRGRGSNVNMYNSIEDITLDCGTGNLGAAALAFSSSNTGKIQNVTLKSEGPEYAGIGMWMYHGHQAYAKNLTIDGFSTGIVAEQGCVAFEHTKMKNITGTAIAAGNPTISFVDCQIETSGSGVAVRDGGMISLVKSKLTHTGKAGGFGARIFEGYVYLRHVEMENFGMGVINGYENVLPNGVIEEYNSGDRSYQLFPNSKPYLELPIKEQEEYHWNGDRSLVAEVDSFGAKGDGVTDSTKAIQAAMNSGKEYIVFGEGRYLCSNEIKIPKTVKAVGFMYCDFAITKDFAEEKEKGLFAIEEDSEDMLYLEDGFVFEKFYGYIRFIRHSAKRDLVVSDLHVQTGAVYFNTVGGSNVLMDNVASTMGVFGGIGYGTVPCFRFSHGQKVWIRQFNPERSVDNALIEDNSDLWVLGFKTEGPSGKAFNVRGNSRLEVNGGNAIIASDTEIPCIECENSSVFAFLRTGGCGPHHQFTIVVKEIRDGCERVLRPHKMPKYGIEYYYIPGYVSNK